MDQSSPGFGFTPNNMNSSQFAARFAQMLRDYPDALPDRKRFIGLLKDLFPQQKKEINLLSFLYDLGITAEIESAGDIDNAFAHRFKKRLQDEYGVTDDDAKWAVATWCECYGKEVLSKRRRSSTPEFTNTTNKKIQHGYKGIRFLSCFLAGLILIGVFFVYRTVANKESVHSAPQIEDVILLRHEIKLNMSYTIPHGI